MTKATNSFFFNVLMCTGMILENVRLSFFGCKIVKFPRHVLAVESRFISLSKLCSAPSFTRAPL